MNGAAPVDVRAADDGFERHYTEKIWSLIPEIYRHEDGIARDPGQLRALVELLAAEAATARRSVDRLWADTRIDEADDWAIPYIGALVGARLVSARNRAGRRAAVKRAIHYRRRNGTRSLLETLADDIADWDAVASEAFRRLFRTMHLLDGPSTPGPVTRSPLWGFPDLRSARAGDVLDGPFDDLPHRPDFRRMSGHRGRYNIPKVNLHLFRHYSFALRGVTPVRLDDRHWLLDPSGRDVPLYQRGGAPGEECRTRREWEVRAPLDCRRLDAAVFAPTIDGVPPGMEDDLTPLYGRAFASEAELMHLARALRPDVAQPPNARLLLAAAIVDGCPKRELLPGGDPGTLSLALAVAAEDAAGPPPFGPESLYGADLTGWAQGLALPDWAEILVDPSTGRVLLADAAPAAALHALVHFYGAFWPVGAGTHDRSTSLRPEGFTVIGTSAPDFASDRSGTERLTDSATYRPVIAATDAITVDGSWRLEAANGERPYVALSPSGDVLTIRPAAGGATLEIDGAWLAVLAQAGGTPATRIVLDGAWSLVRLTHVTLDPGGELAALPGDAPGLQPTVILEAAGEIDTLVVDRCVTGPIEERADATDPCSANTIEVRDSIIVGRQGEPALRARSAAVRIVRSTVFGDVVAGRLHADHVLADGRLLVEDAQNSCVRFSAAVAHAGPSAVDGYESTFYPDRLPPGIFVSRRFGDPGLAQLGESAPSEIGRGGEDGTEIGAFNFALAPVKRSDLRAKVDEHMPINAVTQFVLET